MYIFQFPLNVLTEFSDKNICHYNKRAQTCHLLCKRPGCYYSTSKTHGRDRIFKRAWTSHSATSCVRDQDATTSPVRQMWETGSLKRLEPATSCVRDQDATTAPVRHMWETGSLKRLEPATSCARDQNVTTSPVRHMWETGSLKRLEPATSCVRDQDVTTAPVRHMWETGSLNWAQFMLQWFIRFPEFTEFQCFDWIRMNSLTFVL